MSRTRRMGLALVGGAGRQIVTVLVGLWLSPFLLEHLGSTRYGLWLVALQVTTYLAVLDLGTLGLLPRDVGEAVGRAGGERRSPEVAREVARSVIALVVQTPFVAVGACVGLALAPAEWGPVLPALRWVLLVYVLAFPLRAAAPVLTGLQEFTTAIAISTGAWALQVILTVALVLAGLEFEALAVGWIAGHFAEAGAALAVVIRRYPSLIPRGIPAGVVDSLRDHWRRGAWLTLQKLAEMVARGMDLLLVDRLLATTLVAPYSFTIRLAYFGTTLAQMIGPYAVPGLSEIRGSQDRDRLLRATQALTRAMLLAHGAVACVVLFVNRNFVALWVGGDQYAGVVVTVCAVVGTVGTTLSIGFGALLLSMNRPRPVALVTVLEAALFVAGSFVLADRVGVAGIAMSTAAAIWLRLPVLAWSTAQAMESSLWEQIRGLVPWALRFIPLAAAAAYLGEFFPPPGWVGLFARSAVAALVYAAVMSPLAFSGPLGEYVRPRVSALMVSWRRS